MLAWSSEMPIVWHQRAAWKSGTWNPGVVLCVEVGSGKSGGKGRVCYFSLILSLKSSDQLSWKSWESSMAAPGEALLTPPQLKLSLLTGISPSHPEKR